MLLVAWLSFFYFFFWTIGYLVYFAMVWIPMYFTSPEMPVTNFPWMDAGVTWPGLAALYSLNFWLIWSDAIVFISPVSTLFSIIFNDIHDGDYGSITTSIFLYIILAIVQAVKFIFYMVQFGLCDSFGEQCRPYDGSTGSFTNTNPQFLGLVIFSGMIIFFIVLWIALTAWIRESYKSWKRDYYLSDARSVNDIKVQERKIQEQESRLATMDAFLRAQFKEAWTEFAATTLKGNAPFGVFSSASSYDPNADTPFPSQYAERDETGSANSSFIEKSASMIGSEFKNIRGSLSNAWNNATDSNVNRRNKNILGKNQ